MVLGPELGRGARSIVYRWDRFDAVKLTLPTIPDRWLRDELQLASVAHRCGAPTPGGWRLIEVAGAAGLASRMVQGPTMWEALVAEPHRTDELATELSRLQAALFAGPSTYDLPQQRDRIRAKIRRAAWELDSRLAGALDLPSSGSDAAAPAGALCHGDLHPRNVILSPDGPVVIDWFDAGRGEPAADVARTSLLLSEPDRGLIPGPSPERATVQRFHRRYLDSIVAATGLDPGAVDRWRIVQQVARLAEGFGRETATDLAALVDRRAGAGAPR